MSLKKQSSLMTASVLGAGLAAAGLAVPVVAAEEAPAQTPDTLKEQYDQAVDQTVQAGNEFSAASDALDEARQNQTDASAQVKDTNEALDNAVQEVNYYSDPANQLTAQDTYNEAQESLSNANEQYVQQITDAANTAGKEAEDNRNALNGVQQDQNQVSADIEQGKDDLNKAEISENNAKDTLNQVSDALNKADESAAKADDAASKAENKANDSQNALNGTKTDLNNVKTDLSDKEDELKKAGQSVTDASDHLSDITENKIPEAKDKLDASNAGIKDTESSLGGTLDDKKKDLENSGTSLKNLAGSEKDAADKLQNALDEKNKLLGQLDDLDKKVNDGTEELDSFRNNASQAADKYDAAVKNQNQIASNLADLKAQADALRNKIENFQTSPELTEQLEKLQRQLEDVEAQYNQGSLGFFEYMAQHGDTGAELAKQILLNDPANPYMNPAYIPIGQTDPDAIEATLKKFYEDFNLTQIGNANDATSLENMRLALGMLMEGNVLRTNDTDKNGNSRNLKPYVVTSQMMALSQLQANATEHKVAHSGMFNIGENLAWGHEIYADFDYTSLSIEDLLCPWKDASASFRTLYYSPYVSWYDLERDNLFTNNGGEIGHYLALIRESNVYTGGAWNQKQDIWGSTQEQSFKGLNPAYVKEDYTLGYHEVGTVYTLEEYEALFLEYFSGLVNQKADLQKKIEETLNAIANEKNLLEAQHSKVVADIETAEASLAKAKNETAAAKDAKDEADTVLAEKQSEIDGLLNQQESLLSSLEKVEASLPSLQDKLDKVHADQKAETARHDGLVKDISTLTALYEKRDALNTAYSQLIEEQAAAKTALASAELHRADVQKERDALADKANKLNDLLNTQTAQAAADAKDAKEKRAVADQALAEAKSAQSAYDEAKKNHDALAADKAAKADQLDKLNKKLEDLKKKEAELTKKQNSLDAGYAVMKEALDLFTSPDADPTEASKAVLDRLETLKEQQAEAVKDEQKALEKAAEELNRYQEEYLRALEEKAQAAREDLEKAKENEKKALAALTEAEALYKEKEADYKSALLFEKTIYDLWKEAEEAAKPVWNKTFENEGYIVKADTSSETVPSDLKHLELVTKPVDSEDNFGLPASHKTAAFDIHFVDENGKEVPVKGTFVVTMPVPEEMNGQSNVHLYHKADATAKLEEIKDVVEKDGKYTFTTRSFSWYIVAFEPETQDDPTKPDAPVNPENPVKPGTSDKDDNKPNKPSSPDKNPDDPARPVKPSTSDKNDQKPGKTDKPSASGSDKKPASGKKDTAVSAGATSTVRLTADSAASKTVSPNTGVGAEAAVDTWTLLQSAAGFGLFGFLKKIKNSKKNK